MRVLVTGGTGLVGSALREIAYKYVGCEFNLLSSNMCDLRSKEETEELFEKFKPTYSESLQKDLFSDIKFA